MSSNLMYLHLICSFILSSGVGSKYESVDGVICFGLLSIGGIVLSAVLDRNK